MLWLAFLFSALVAYGVTRLSVMLALHRGVLDVPSDRSFHAQPMPRLGGIGILIAEVVTFAGLVAAERFGLVEVSFLTRDVLVLVGAGMGMAVTGIYDDLYRLRPPTKFLMQFIMASIVLGSGFKIQSVAILGLGPVSLGWVAFPVTILWLTGFSNVFNFMDGINGMSAVTAAVYFLFFAILGASVGATELVALALVLGGSCIGFLPHNFPAARTFMGDTGSMLLGMSIAFFVVCLAQRAPVLLIPLLLVCSVYLWDGGFTLICRLRRRENIFQAHRSHLYQRLVRLGQSHVTITLLYLLLHTMMGCLALAYLWSETVLRAAILAVTLMILVAFAVSVRWLEQRGARE